MSEEIYINVTPRETRLAVIENGVVQDIYLERESKQGLVGSIFVGKVVRVLPGMQAAFIDIGLEKAAFLHINDMLEFDSEDEEEPKPQECISTILRESQTLAVQVIKDPLGNKGARLTTRTSLPSRYLVYMPELSYIGISQRIEDEQERQRLKDAIAALHTQEVGGFIARTAAEGVDEKSIENDYVYLRKYWKNIQNKIAKAKVGDKVHEDLPLYLRAIRDFTGPQTERIKIDSHDAFVKAVEFSKEFVPSLQDQIQQYSAERPLFDLHNIEDEIQKALSRKVPLKSGSYLIFDQTEAMTTIDVNTGGFVGHRNLEETIFKTNLEAATSIVRQCRLRNLGGIIIIDFIDMVDEEHKRQVLRALEKALTRDHAKTNISEVSQLGLVEMTRKRTRESLEHLLCETCSTCEGRGTIKSPETVCHEIFREVLRSDRAYDGKSYLVLASEQVVDRMLDEESTTVAELEGGLGKSITFRVETLYTQEQYDVVLM